MKSINVLKLSKDELLDLYGVELNDDGSVYDPVEDKTFPNVGAWKYFADQQEKDDLYGGVEKTGGKYYYDDD